MGKVNGFFLAALIACLTLTFSAPVVVAQDQTDDKQRDTQTKTRFDWSPGRFVKTVFAEERTETEDPMYLDFMFFGLIQASLYNEPKYTVTQFSFLKLPFFHVTLSPNLTEKVKLTEDVSVDMSELRDDIPPYLWRLEKPLFCFYDKILIDTRQKENSLESTAAPQKDEGWPAEGVIIRKRILDSIAVQLYASTVWDKHYYFNTFLDMPLVTTYASHKSPNKYEVNWLKMDWGHLYHNSRIKGEEKTHLLKVMPFALYQREASKAKQKKEFGVMQLGASKGFLGASLLQNERKDSGEACTQILRLPLIGPVWANWKDSTQKHALPFPRLLSWGKFKY